jgi:uncharacterized protein YodC (DUF2158 family)
MCGLLVPAEPGGPQVVTDTAAGAALTRCHLRYGGQTIAFTKTWLTGDRATELSGGRCLEVL